MQKKQTKRGRVNGIERKARNERERKERNTSINLYQSVGRGNRRSDKNEKTRWQGSLALEKKKNMGQ